MDFEHDPVGVYDNTRLSSDFAHLVGRGQGFAEGRVSIVPTEHGKSLRVRYPKARWVPTREAPSSW